MKTLLKTFLCLLLFFAFSCGGGKKDESAQPPESVDESVEESVDEGTTDMNFEVDDVYKCPMDCEDGKEYEVEGACPVCGMELKHENEEAHDDSHSPEDHEEEEDNEHEGETKNDFNDE